MRLQGSFTVGCTALLALAVAGAPLPAQAKPPAAVMHLDARNSAWAQGQHYVVLLSLEGLGWDDAARDDAKNLLALGRRGAWAPQGMLPSYPALEWPNQFSIVTGLYPGQHGIVAGSFFDPVRQARFFAADATAAADGSWYSGTPLWSLADGQGIRTACIGWPGCSAQIAGFQPSYRSSCCGQSGAEIRQIVSWLRLPEAERPHFIAVQFNEPGQSARRFGPHAPETRSAVRRMDAEMGRLKAELDATHLPIDLVVVSDHGIANTDGGWITLDRLADLSGFDTDGMLLYAKNEADRVRVYNQLKKATSEFFVYRLKNVPADLHLRNARTGDPVIFATGPYPIRAHGPAAGMPDASPLLGLDGFDARVVPEMKAIFFAAGPDIVEGRTVAPFESVNLYPWLAHLLGLTPPKTDGSLNILSGILRDNGD